MEIIRKFRQVISEKPTLILLALLFLQILFLSIDALTGSRRHRIVWLSQTLPLLLIYPALWKEKYWAWVVAIVLTFFNFTGLFFLLTNWSEYVTRLQPMFQDAPLRTTYYHILFPTLNLVILVLLICQKNEFD